MYIQSNFSVSNQYVSLSLVISFFSVLLFLFAFSPSLMGLYILLISFYYMATCKSLLVLILCFFNISCGFAFDYYLRVNYAVYGFYRGDGITIELLAFVFTFFFLCLAFLDSLMDSERKKGVIVNAKMPSFSKLFYFPCLVLILWCIVFLFFNSGNIFSANFDLDELQKYSFLEYFAIVVYVFLSSAKTYFLKRVSYFIVFVFILFLLLASYRMVGIVVILSVFFFIYNGRYVSRKLMFWMWLLGYAIFGLINLLRADSEITFNLFLGYKDFGYLDNTFTGVIETSLIYSYVSEVKGGYKVFLEFLGTIAPLPSSLLPNEMVYFDKLDTQYPVRIPGGGMVSGFIVYFSYAFFPVLLIYLYLALNKGNKSYLYGMLAYISLITVSRWYLYGAYSLFKFVGVLSVFYFINYFLNKTNNIKS